MIIEKTFPQFIGSIQNHGCLIGFKLTDQRIQLASENIQNFLGFSHRAALSMKLEHLLGIQFCAKVLSAAQELKKESSCGIYFKPSVGYENFDAYLYSSGGLHFVELERPLKNEITSALGEKDLVEKLKSALKACEDLTRLSTLLCESVRSVTGMDHVRLYQFLAPIGHDDILAEAHDPKASFSNHHPFSSSSIPKTERDLYLRNSVRSIPNILAPACRISPGLDPDTKNPMDLSDSRLRAVFPSHLEYLRNMKVEACHSFAIIIDGSLWGLIACHHLLPYVLSAEKRGDCQELTQIYASMAGSFA